MANMIQCTVGNNVKRNTVITPSTTTLRDILESNGIDYTRGMTTLDGASLQPGDLDKSFDAFGIASRCSLLNVVKADNAASVTIAGSAVVITSAIQLDDIKLIEKYRPEALTLYEGEGKEKTPVFVVATGKNGGINDFGAVFAPAPADEHKAQVTMLVGNVPNGQSVKDFVSDKIGRALLKLNKLEESIPATKTEIAAEKAEIEAHITIA